MKPHDWKTCWFCIGVRLIFIVGMYMMAVVCLVGSVWDLAHGRWLIAGREFLGVPLCLGMMVLSLKTMAALDKGFDWLFRKIEAKFQ